MDKKMYEEYFENVVDHVADNHYRRCLKLKGRNQQNLPVFDFSYSEVIANNEQWASLSHFLEITYEEAPAFLVVNCSCLVINPYQQVVYKSAFSTAFTDYRSKFWLYAVLFGKDYFPFVKKVEWFTSPKYLPEAPNVLSEFSKRILPK